MCYCTYGGESHGWSGVSEGRQLHKLWKEFGFSFDVIVSSDDYSVYIRVSFSDDDNLAVQF